MSQEPFQLTSIRLPEPPNHFEEAERIARGMCHRKNGSKRQAVRAWARAIKAGLKEKLEAMR